MAMVNKTSLYLIKALTEMARLEKGVFIGAGDLAKRIEVPSNYLSKNLQILARHGLLDSQKGKGGAKQEGYAVRRTGDATAILIGFPSVGKSTILNAITNADSQVASYAFTTLTCIPGLLAYKGSKIQVLDVPGIVTGAAAGTGRGKEVLAVIQNADLIMFILDSQHPEHLPALQKEVYDAHVRVNQRRPDVTIKKTGKGGLDIGTTIKMTHMKRKTMESILREFGIANAQVVIRENITADQFIDSIENNKLYRSSLIVVSKSDLISEDEKNTLQKQLCPDIFISAKNKDNIEELKELIFSRLNFVRIFLKEYGKDPDLEEPMIMQEENRLRDVCTKLHKDSVLAHEIVTQGGEIFEKDLVDTIQHLKKLYKLMN